MQLQFHPYGLPLILSAISSGTIVYIAWRRRNAPGALSLIGMMLGITIWTLAYTLMWSSTTLDSQIFWLNTTYFGVIVVPLAFLIFVVQVTYGSWLTKRILTLLTLEPLVILIIVWTNGFHHLFHSSFQLENVAGLTTLHWTRGPWFWVNVAYSYGVILAGEIILVRNILRSMSVFRVQLITILIGSTIPWIASLFTQFWFSRFSDLDLAPIAFSLAGFFYAFGLFQQGLLDIVPIARNILVEHMSDGLIVLDARHRILDINPAAESLLGLRARESIGKDGVQLYPELKTMILNAQEAGHEHRAEVQGRINPSRHFDLTITQLPKNKGKTTGYLIIFRDITGHWQTERDLRNANEQLGTRLQEITILEDELREQAIRDPLTGVYNRRFLDETLSNELARAKENDNTLCLIMLDLDHFKDINDFYGHKAGDIMLKGLADKIKHITRGGDLACRYGGDEFIIILPNIPLETAHQRAEQVRQSFENFNASFKNQIISTTASLGVAVYPLHGLTADRLLRSADKALYASKAAGRNRVTVFDLNSEMNTMPAPRQNTRKAKD